MPHMSLGLMLRLNVHTLDNLGSFMSRYCRQQMLWYLLLYIAKHTLRAHCHGFYEPFLGETRPSALGMLDPIYGPCKPVYLFTTRRRTPKNIFSAEKGRKYLKKGMGRKGSISKYFPCTISVEQENSFVQIFSSFLCGENIFWRSSSRCE